MNPGALASRLARPPVARDNALPNTREGHGMEEPQAHRQLFEEMYRLIRDKAHLLLPRRGRDPLLSRTTDLVQEAFLRVVPGAPPFNDSEHFLQIVCQAMRRVLVDQARRTQTARRGGAAGALEELARQVGASAAGQDHTVVDVDDALRRLEVRHADLARIVERMVFGGLGIEETARAMGVTIHQVRLARAALRDLLEERGDREATG